MRRFILDRDHRKKHGFYFGMAFSGSTKINPYDHHCLVHLAKTLESAVGFFLCIVVGDKGVTVFSSLYRGKDCFFSDGSDGFILATDPAFLQSLSNNTAAPLNVEYCTNFILNDHTYNGDTAFANVSQIMLGEILTFHRNGLIDRNGITAAIPDCSDIIDIHKHNMQTFVPLFKSVSLMFSGGLDSSTLFFVLDGLGFDFSCLHTTTTEDPNSTEIDEARSVAASRGRDIVELRAKVPSMEKKRFTLCTLDTVTSPYDVDIMELLDGSEKPDNHDPKVNATHSHDLLQLNGHGGEHLFLQNPSRAIGYDAFYYGDVVNAVKEIVKFCTLKKEFVFPVILTTIANLLRIGHPRRSCDQHRSEWCQASSTVPSRRHHLLMGADPRSAKYQHLLGILSVLHSCPRIDSLENISLSPFVLQNMVSYVINLPVSKLYSDTFDRLPIRKALYEYSRNEVAWRRTKRSSSGFLFNVLRRNHDNFNKALCEGTVARTLGIYVSKLNSCISYNAHIALTDDLPALLRMYQLETFIRKPLYRFN
ncbi:hypothetical protein [Phyllobacterium zundukense]|uniref:Uncharacterized protein n=1 Tax=Phyllobacterium zundukense TaxID=1867719 RepID=A0ACD4D7L4_9HYPH|nr:hypothetical protein [Phyllobacterium zundukense]UXN61802.1 hypothetical protein N8E88_17315 [Phyllobacterium zundukense]